MHVKLQNRLYRWLPNRHFCFGRCVPNVHLRQEEALIQMRVKWVSLLEELEFGKQALNAATYNAIGNAGVYYGFKRPGCISVSEIA